MSNNLKIKDIIRNLLLALILVVPIITFFIPYDKYYTDLLRLFSNIGPFVWIILDVVLYVFLLKQVESNQKANIVLMLVIALFSIIILLLPYRFNFTYRFDDRIRTWGASYWLLLFFISKRSGYTNHQFNIIAYIFLLPMALWNLFASLIF